LYREASSGDRVIKTHPKPVTGQGVGKSKLKDENVVLTEEGMVILRDIHRFPDSDRWRMAIFDQARSLPWDETAGVEKLRDRHLAFERYGSSAPAEEKDAPLQGASSSGVAGSSIPSSRPAPHEVEAPAARPKSRSKPTGASSTITSTKRPAGVTAPSPSKYVKVSQRWVEVPTSTSSSSAAAASLPEVRVPKFSSEPTLVFDLNEKGDTLCDELWHRKWQAPRDKEFQRLTDFDIYEDVSEDQGKSTLGKGEAKLVPSMWKGAAMLSRW
jgi:hypothetical protein